MVLATSAVACRRRLPLPVDAGPPAAPPAPSFAQLASASPEQIWIVARDGDPLELARLCDEVGPERLGEVVADEAAAPDDRATAIRALAYADDPTPGLDAVCRVAGGAPEMSTLALQTVAQVAPRRRPIEEIEGGAWRRCGTALFALLQKTRDPTRRELAIRALVGIADRGAFDPKLVPSR